ncbi:MAG: hypothetical protein EP307_04625 [Rhodobacteraceae bacterium]|nr:MAG: hypothetical protein EP307_04625 [Paracoccaceae bacterium]
MIRSLGVISILVLAACGGGRSGPGEPSVARFAATTGPIASACMGSGRKGVNRATCGCVQMAADQTLTGADQRRGASFFGDPERAHAVRLSDTPQDDAFWERWTEFGRAAEQLCR